MGNENRAVIEVEINPDGVLTGARVVNNQLDNIKNKSEQATNSQTNLLKGLGKELLGFAQNVGVASGALQEIKFTDAIKEVRNLDSIASRLGQSFGVSGDVMRKSFDDLEKRVGVSATQIAGMTATLGDLTYDAAGSAQAIEGLVTSAKAWGADVSKSLSWGVTLRNSLSVVGDTQKELGRIEDLAKRLEVVGGPVALLDTLAALSPQLAEVSTKSDEARARLVALVAATGKGLNPAQAREAASSALSEVKGHQPEIERLLKRRISNDEGKIVDPLGVLRDVQSKSREKWQNPNTRRANMMFSMGPQLGQLLERTDFQEAGEQASKARDTGTVRQAFSDYRMTDRNELRNRRDLHTGALTRVGADKSMAMSDFLINELGAEGAAETGLVGSASMKAHELAKKYAPSYAPLVAGVGAGLTTGYGLSRVAIKRGYNVWNHIPEALGGKGRTSSNSDMSAAPPPQDNRALVSAIDKLPQKIGDEVASAIQRPQYRPPNQAGQNY